MPRTRARAAAHAHPRPRLCFLWMTQRAHSVLLQAAVHKTSGAQRGVISHPARSPAARHEVRPCHPRYKSYPFIARCRRRQATPHYRRGPPCTACLWRWRWHPPVRAPLHSGRIQRSRSHFQVSNGCIAVLWLTHACIALLWLTHTHSTQHTAHNTCASALGRRYHGDAGASKLSAPRVFSLGLLQARGCRPGCADGERSRHALVRGRNFPGCASSPPLVAYTRGRGPAGGGRGQAGRSSPLPQTRPGQAQLYSWLRSHIRPLGYGTWLCTWLCRWASSSTRAPCSRCSATGQVKSAHRAAPGTTMGMHTPYEPHIRDSGRL